MYTVQIMPMKEQNVRCPSIPILPNLRNKWTSFFRQYQNIGKVLVKIENKYS